VKITEGETQTVQRKLKNGIAYLCSTSIGFIEFNDSLHANSISPTQVSVDPSP
jgi:hypothetical protein